MDKNSPDANLASEPQLRFGKIDGLASRVAAAMSAARKLLFSTQHEDGYWCGELEADTTLESDYILLHTLLGTGDPERFRKAANWIVQHQHLGEGVFRIEAGGTRGRSSRAAARPQEDPRTRRSHRGKHLHQDLSVL